MRLWAIGMWTAMVIVAPWGCETRPAAQPSSSVERAPTSTSSSLITTPPNPGEPPVATPPQSEVSPFDQAMRCLADPLCSKEDWARLYVVAADAGKLPVEPAGLSSGLHCYVLLRGVGGPADPVRARRCFERAVAASDCEGSPWLPRFELAALWLTGRGGPAKPASVQPLLEPCYQDGAVEVVRQKARHAEAHPGTVTKLDFCGDIAGTTLSQSACAQIDNELSSMDTKLIAKEPHFAANDKVRGAYAAANEAFLAYAYAEATWNRDFWRGGSGAPLVFAGTYGTLLKRRNARLRAITSVDYQGRDATRKAAAKELKREYEGARMGAEDAPRRKLLDEAQHAFVGYRRAETNLYVAVLAGQHEEQGVRDQVSTDLTLARSEAIRESFRP